MQILWYFEFIWNQNYYFFSSLQSVKYNILLTAGAPFKLYQKHRILLACKYKMCYESKVYNIIEQWYLECDLFPEHVTVSDRFILEGRPTHMWLQICKCATCKNKYIMASWKWSFCYTLANNRRQHDRVNYLAVYTSYESLRIISLHKL